MRFRWIYFRVESFDFSSVFYLNIQVFYVFLHSHRIWIVSKTPGTRRQVALRFWLLKLNSSDSTLIAELTKITGFILLIGHLADFYEFNSWAIFSHGYCGEKWQKYHTTVKWKIYAIYKNSWFQFVHLGYWSYCFTGRKIDIFEI